MEYPPHMFSRRALLQGAVIVATAAIGLDACSGRPANMPSDSEPGSIPGSGTEAEPIFKVAGYALADQELAIPEGAAIDRLHAAFGLPNEDGEVTGPEYSPGFIAGLGGLSTKTEVVLSIGGYQDESGQDSLLEKWKRGLTNPDKLVASMLKARDGLATISGREVGIDIDFEYPTAGQRDELVDLISRIRSATPESLLTMAVPTAYNRAGFDLRRLTPLVNNFNFMSYDIGGPWSDVSTDNAPFDQVKSELDTVIGEAGDESKILVGWAGYGYQIKGASGPDQPFDKQTSAALPPILVKDIPANAITAPGQAIINGNRVNFMAPEELESRSAEIRAKYPRIAGNFVWKITDVTGPFVSAMRGKAN